MTFRPRTLALTATAAATVAASALLGLPGAHAVTPTCFGKPATIVGTDAPDDLRGGPDDVVFGGPGNDYVLGGVVCGGSGADTVDGYSEEGGITDNKLDGGRGSDWVGGYFGVDVLVGGRGADRLVDTDDDDWPDYEDPGVDIMRGGPGDDEVTSTSGSDRVYGDAGNDDLYA